jgi:hypothetical protein
MIAEAERFSDFRMSGAEFAKHVLRLQRFVPCNQFADGMWALGAQGLYNNCHHCFRKRAQARRPYFHHSTYDAGVPVSHVASMSAIT